MPYDLETKDGIVLYNIPDEMPQDAPELKQLVQAERAKRRTASPEFQAKVKAEQDRVRAETDPLKDMSTGERVLANIGAGMSDLALGARQLFGAATDEEVADKRALDERLAESTTGGKALQIVGNVAPTLAVPVGGFLRGVQAGGRVLRAALGGRPVAQAAPRAAGAGRLGTAESIGDAALAGTAGGALMPTLGDESRLLNMAAGAAGGVVLPGAVAAFQAGRRAFTRGGAREKAAETLVKAVGQGNARQAVGDIQTYYPRGAEDIPVSTAAILQNPEVAMLERSSRVNPDQRAGWSQFDLDQSQAAWRNVQQATDEAGELAARKQARSENWDANWARAEQGVRPRNFAQRMGQLKLALDQAARSPEAVNPQVMAVLKEIDDTVVRMGQDFSPAHLQQLRAQFNGKVKPMAASAMQSAPRDNPAIISLIQEMDDILNASTGGRWDKVRQGYARDSEGVHAAAAAQQVRNAFVEPTSGLPRGVGLMTPEGAIPQVTPNRITQAVGGATLPGQKVALSDPAMQRLTATAEALRRQGITKQVANAATPGGGANTAGDLAIQAASMNGGPITGAAIQSVAQRIRGAVQGRYDEALALALRNPDEAARMLDMKLAMNVPLSRTEQLLLQGLRASTTAAGGALAPSTTQAGPQAPLQFP